MGWFERRCRFGRSSPNPSVGSWCATSSRLAGLLSGWNHPLPSLEGNDSRSLGGFVQDHRQTHASFGKALLRRLGGARLINLADGQVLGEHPLSHVIVFGAALQFDVRFDGNFFREGIVDRRLRSLVAL